MRLSPCGFGTSHVKSDPEVAFLPSRPQGMPRQPQGARTHYRWQPRHGSLREHANMVGVCAGREAASLGVLSLTRGELPVDPGVSLMFVMPRDVQSTQVTSVRSPGLGLLATWQVADMG